MSATYTILREIQSFLIHVRDTYLHDQDDEENDLEAKGLIEAIDDLQAQILNRTHPRILLTDTWRARAETYADDAVKMQQADIFDTSLVTLYRELARTWREAARELDRIT